MREYLGEIVTIIVLVFFIIAFCFGVYVMAINEDKALWNNGHCDNCGGEWKYEQAVGHRFRTSYIYVCDKCGKRIEVDEIR